MRDQASLPAGVGDPGRASEGSSPGDALMALIRRASMESRLSGQSLAVNRELLVIGVSRQLWAAVDRAVQAC